MNINNLEFEIRILDHENNSVIEMRTFLLLNTNIQPVIINLFDIIHINETNILKKIRNIHDIKQNFLKEILRLKKKQRMRMYKYRKQTYVFEKILPSSRKEFNLFSTSVRNMFIKLDELRMFLEC